MSSILDHVEQAVPRATVYGAMKGSPVFIGKYYREVNPASNATSYQYKSGERRITFVLASPDKTIFNDMRSCYLRFDIKNIEGTAANDGLGAIAEPASNLFERIVIKMNGTVVEDISNFDKLTSYFKRALITREQKNARGREGYDYVGPNVKDNIITTTVVADGNAAVATGSGNVTVKTQDARQFLKVGDVIINVGNTSKITAINSATQIVVDQIAVQVGDGAPLVVKRSGQSAGVQDFNNLGQENYIKEKRGKQGDRLCVKLDMSGIMNVQQLLSGYYSPLEIDLYLQDPAICGVAYGVAAAAPVAVANIEIQNVRLCMDQVVMSPEYVSAFESALLANSSAQGIQIPFSTYYNYQQNITTNHAATAENTTTFWIRKPVRYLKSVYFGAYPSTFKSGVFDAYRPCRCYPEVTRTKGHGNANPGDNANAKINRWQISIGTKTYREIDDTAVPDGAAALRFDCNESQIMFSKAVGHYNDYATETAEFNADQRVLNNAVQGIDLEFSPDNDVLASETTLNSNDVRVQIRETGNATNNNWEIFTMLNYQASIALFPGNETRLLVT